MPFTEIAPLTKNTAILLCTHMHMHAEVKRLLRRIRKNPRIHGLLILGMRLWWTKISKITIYLFLWTHAKVMKLIVFSKGPNVDTWKLKLDEAWAMSTLNPVLVMIEANWQKFLLGRVEKLRIFCTTSFKLARLDVIIKSYEGFREVEAAG